MRLSVIIYIQPILLQEPTSHYSMQVHLCVIRELPCATKSSPDFLTSSFAAPRLNWLLKLTVWRGGGLQSSFGGAEQPQVIELLAYNVGGQLVLRGQLVLGPDVLGGHVVLGPAVRGNSWSYIHCKNKVVVSTREWLHWLQTNWRDSGYERFAMVLKTNWIR